MFQSPREPSVDYSPCNDASFIYIKPQGFLHIISHNRSSMLKTEMIFKSQLEKIERISLDFMAFVEFITIFNKQIVWSVSTPRPLNVGTCCTYSCAVFLWKETVACIHWINQGFWIQSLIKIWITLVSWLNMFHNAMRRYAHFIKYCFICLLKIGKVQKIERQEHNYRRYIWEK